MTDAAAPRTVPGGATMHVIATAGHVDHGKSTLVRALTGMEPDRWAEERRRGMTIDLGYAWTVLPGGTQIAFVDVPGHQRFVSNMLAGVGPVPAVLFVVAADQGWSAQSSEHLDALDALGVGHGVLAVTRCDLGDSELAEAEARDHLAGSSLAGIEAVAVSPPAGVGLDELRAALERMSGELPAPHRRATRLWVDRIFTIRGAGTVVTGTLGSGTIRAGDELQLRPSGRLVRVRGIETLKARVDDVSAVSRVAVNLRGVDTDEIRRGDALTEPGGWEDVAVMDVRLTRTDRLSTGVVVHIGSASVPARLRRLGPDTARLTLEAPLPVHLGERAVLRDPGAHRVVAGAVVLDTMPAPLRGRGAAARRAAELDHVSGVPDVAAEVRRRRAVRVEALVAAGVPVPTGELPKGVVLAGEWLVDAAEWTRWGGELVAAVDGWAAEHPLLPGLPRRSAAGALGLPDPALVDPLVGALPDLVSDADGVHRRGVGARAPAQIERVLDGVLAHLGAEPFDAPEAAELSAAGLTDKYLAIATRAGRLVRVGPGVYLRPEAIDEAIARLALLAQPFTMSEARQALNTTRRVAVPLLEYLDRTHRTHRVDSQRRSLGP